MARSMLRIPPKLAPSLPFSSHLSCSSSSSFRFTSSRCSSLLTTSPSLSLPSSLSSSTSSLRSRWSHRPLSCHRSFSDMAEAADFSLPVNNDISDLFAEPIKLAPKPPTPPIGIGKLQGEYRELVGRQATEYLMAIDSRIPAVITAFRDTRKRILLSFDKLELQRVLKQGQIYNRVFEVTLPDFQKPLRVLIAKVNYHTATDAVMNVEMTAFIEGAKNRVVMPVVLKDVDDCIGIKKGGVLSLSFSSVPMWWTGDTNIPASLEVSLRTAKMNSVQRLFDQRIHPHLSPIHKHIDYVFSSIRGSKKAEEEEEAKEKAAAAAAAADKAKATAAAGSAKPAAAAEKKDEPKKDDAKKK